MTDAITRAIEKYGADVVCTTLESMLTPERIARIDAVLAARLQSVITIVEDTYDPHNAAATIRTTEAIGLAELHVIEPGERFSAARGVTRGAHRWIELHRWQRCEDAVSALHARGFRVFAASPPPRGGDGGSPREALGYTERSLRSLGPDAKHSIDDVDVTQPIAVAFGNEHAGLSDAALAVCDGTLAVPMFGFTESFNLSVTVALAMSRIANRRRAAIGALGDLDDTRRRELRARWFALKIRGAVGVLERALG
jgi:tRNA (guanosine-2'-O-)-methyltransferase